MSGGIYCIKCTINNKKYIGSCIDFNKRKSIHLCNMKKNRANKLIQHDYNLYGLDSFVFNIIEEINSDDSTMLIERELYWMNKYKTLVPIYGEEFGYNMKRPKETTKHTRLKMSESKKGISDGEKNPNAKLSINDCFEIKDILLHETDEMVKDKVLRVSKTYNVSIEQIGRIRDGRHWSSNTLGGGIKDW